MSQSKITPVGPYPCNVICPNCNRSILTKTEARASTNTHILALLLCLFGCWLCASILYCTDCARNVDHTCPSCCAYIGTYER